MSDDNNNQYKKIKTVSSYHNPLTNETTLTRIYEDGTRDTRITKPQDWLKGGGYNTTRSTRKEQSEKENPENT